MYVPTSSDGCGPSLFLNLKMDVEKLRFGTVQAQAYLGDVMWFALHRQEFCLIVCQTSSSNDEFLLSGNADLLFEVPIFMARHPDTGRMNRLAYTAFHRFACLALNLTIAL